MKRIGMAIYSNRFETPTGDRLDFSVIISPRGDPEVVNLTIFKIPKFHTRRRKIFGCRLSLKEWCRLREWLPPKCVVM